MFKKFNKSTIIGFSSVLLLLSVFFIYTTIENTKVPKDLAKTSKLMSNIVDDCQKKSIELGFINVRKINNKSNRIVVIKQKKITDGIDIAYKSTILMNYCKKMKLTDYCLGEHCKNMNKHRPYQFLMKMKI